MHFTHLATPADLKAMTDLLQYLFTQEADFKPQPKLQEQGLALILENPNVGEIWLIKDHEKTLGMVSLLYTISTALGAKVAILEDMILHPNYRNKGLGTILLKAAITHANKVGCKRITLLSDTDNESAIAFYKKQGFEKSGMIPLRLMLNNEI